MNENKTDLRVLVFIALVAMGATYFLATYVVPKVLVTMTKAAPATVVSVTDSWLLGERILAKADGKDQASVNVFVMDKSGKGVMGKSVSLTGLSTIVPEAVISDATGKANFKMTSASEGQFPIQATIDGAPMNGKVVVTFRN